ncbi:hypothetical protein [Xylanibacter rarus]|uniref:hypothetical protein n=1 Tax=Xylanibacter rarus TaxID=1676614 RepID=UPI000A9B31AB|nr:hypothetical protein [Xylanibacter rarus]
MAIQKQAQQPHTPTALPSACTGEKPMLMLTSTMQTAEAVTQHNNNNNKKNVIDYRFPKNTTKAP